MTEPTDEQMPPLPEPYFVDQATCDVAWTAAQMFDYARAVLALRPDPLPGMSSMNRHVAYTATDKLRELGYEWTGDGWDKPQHPLTPAQAAAPQLLEALRQYVSAFERHQITNTHGARDFDFTGHIASLANAAIRAAEGGE